MQAADMHTHSLEKSGWKLVSCRNRNAAEYVSMEFHPWHLPEKFVSLSPDFFAELKQFDALGEIGLDRLKGPDLTVQRLYLDALLEAAEALYKPVIIHNVRCESEIFSALKGFSFPVLFHGFCGGVRALEKILEAGFFVSFRTIANSDVASFLKSNGLDNIGIESDDSGRSIDDIAGEISRILDMDVNKSSVETFRKYLSL